MTFDPHDRLMFGIDFNRTPFCSVVIQVQGDTLAVLKEYVLINANTEERASAVRKDFPHRQIFACRDLTGRQLQTSSAI